jgi:hypothetical protein
LFPQLDDQESVLERDFAYRRRAFPSGQPEPPLEPSQRNLPYLQLAVLAASRQGAITGNDKLASLHFCLHTIIRNSGYGQDHPLAFVSLDDINWRFPTWFSARRQAKAGGCGNLQEISLYALGLLQQARGSMQYQKIPIPFRHTTGLPGLKLERQLRRTKLRLGAQLALVKKGKMEMGKNRYAPGTLTGANFELNDLNA